jgi:hypothetical protein
MKGTLNSSVHAERVEPVWMSWFSTSFALTLVFS